MAIGGALRAAIKAGNFVKVASESRRRARALAELNARGGIGRPGRARGADEYLRGRGVDVDAMTAPRTGNPYADWVEEDFGPIFSDSPFGGVNFFDRGRTMKFGGEGARYNLPMTLPTGSRYQGPIQAPYEGMRVAGYDPEYSLIGGLERFGGEMPPIPRAFRSPVPFSPRPFQLLPPRQQQTTTFSFDDIMGTSSFVDPQTGFRYTLNGFPLD
jgi:hypothetical protein